MVGVLRHKPRTIPLRHTSEVDSCMSEDPRRAIDAFLSGSEVPPRVQWPRWS